MAAKPEPSYQINNIIKYAYYFLSKYLKKSFIPKIIPHSVSP